MAKEYVMCFIPKPAFEKMIHCVETLDPYYDEGTKRVLDEIIKNQILVELKGQHDSRQNNKRIDWIEGLLLSKAQDGLKRIIDLVLLPYFKNIQKLNLENTLSRIKLWLNLCDLSEEKKKEYLMRATLRYKKLTPEFKPMSSRNFEQHGLLHVLKSVKR